MPKSPKSSPSKEEAPSIPGIRAYLSVIGKAGGIASGASRRAVRERADAGLLSEGEATAYEKRKEQARKAGASRWTEEK